MEKFLRGLFPTGEPCPPDCADCARQRGLADAAWFDVEYEFPFSMPSLGPFYHAKDWFIEYK